MNSYKKGPKQFIGLGRGGGLAKGTKNIREVRRQESDVLK